MILFLLLHYRDIWKILDKKIGQKPYQGSTCEGQNVLIVGAGPCGLRTAVETQLLGANTILIERRNAFTRNNVLKLWKFLIEDLKSLGKWLFSVVPLDHAIGEISFCKWVLHAYLQFLWLYQFAAVVEV